MTDQELIKRLRHGEGWPITAADRIEDLIAENKRLGQQCEGLMQAGMNNGQALIIAEAKLAKAMEALTIAKQFLGHTWVEQHVNAVLAELEGK